MARSPRKRSARFASSVALFGLLGLTSTGCTGKDPYNPGEPVGKFHVNAALTSSSCGAVPDPWEFDVRLRHDAETLYWVQGSVPISGRVEASRVTLGASGVHEVRPADAKAKMAACAMTRDDMLDVTLRASASADAPAPATIADTGAFVGTLVYRFAPTADSDCSDQLEMGGGTFPSLPCEVRYTVVGTRTDSPAASSESTAK